MGPEQFKRVKKQYEDVSQELLKKESELELVKSNLKSLEQINEQLRKELERGKGMTMGGMSERERQDLEKRVEYYKNLYEQKQSELEKKSGEGDWKRVGDDINKQLDELKRQNQMLMKETQKKDIKDDWRENELMNEVEQLKREKLNLERQIGMDRHLGSQNDKLKGDLEKEQSEKKMLLNRIDDLERQKYKQESDINGLKSQLRTLENQNIKVSPLNI